MKIFSANRIAPDGMPRIAASHLRLFFLPLSHKKDARLIWVKNQKYLQVKIEVNIFLKAYFAKISKHLHPVEFYCHLAVTCNLSRERVINFGNQEVR